MQIKSFKWQLTSYFSELPYLRIEIIFYPIVAEMRPLSNIDNKITKVV